MPRVSLALLLALIGCRGSTTEQPMAGELELCCKAAIDDVSFVGCRATSHCRGSESVWIRGPLTCTADAPDQCEDGHCCTLDLDALATRGHAVPLARPSPELEPAEQPLEPTTPEPAAIDPVPIDWQAQPSAVVVPKLVCSAAREGASVQLDIHVDAAGRVTAATVRRGHAPECDALAIAALLQAEFAPARSPTGEPIAATLVWSYEFEPAATP